MRKFLTLLIILFIVSGKLSAQAASSGSSGGGGKFGIGLTLFGPTGITGKYLINDKMAVEGSIGLWGFGRGLSHFHAVFLYTPVEFNQNASLYVGGGISISEHYYYRERGRSYKGWHWEERDSYTSTNAGLRLPVGISVKTNDKKFEFTGELYLNIGGNNDSYLGLAIAGRYYF